MSEKNAHNFVSSNGQTCSVCGVHWSEHPFAAELADGAPIVMADKPVGFVDDGGDFHCPCGAAHGRGPVDGVNVYRCMKCGKSFMVRGFVSLR